MSKVLKCCACSSNDKLAKAWERKQEKIKKEKKQEHQMFKNMMKHIGYYI